MKLHSLLRPLLLAGIFASAARAQDSGYAFTALAGRPLFTNADGPGALAGFAGPMGVAADQDGNLYVADDFNSTIRKITATGVVSTLAGSPGVSGSEDGNGRAARFRFPRGVAVDRAGVVYVADTQNHTIRRIEPSGAVSTWAGLAGVAGSVDGDRATARFNSPAGVAVDAAGMIYVADSLNSTIRAISPAGVVTTFAGKAGSIGDANGVGGAARFVEPTGVAVDTAGNVYVTDAKASFRSLRRITPAGVVTTVAGLDASVRVSSVAVGADGSIYVTEFATIIKISSDGGVATLAGWPGLEGYADGVGRAARFFFPSGLTVDATGNVYVADLANNAIRKITSTGDVTTFAGQGPSAGHDDGAGTAAQFNTPVSAAVDLAGTIYVADYYNATIRKISASGQVTTFVGTPDTGFFSPSGIATDRAGNVYVSDGLPDFGSSQIQKITPAGQVTTLAGQIGGTGFLDGQGSAARFRFPWGLAVDANGNVYVADSGNSAVRKITPGGLVTTVAGGLRGARGEDGVGLAAKFVQPSGVAIDRAGNLYVSDTGDFTVRKIAPDGAVTTIAGAHGEPGTADGRGDAARFALALGIAVDRLDQLYVADGHDRIRRISPAGEVTTIAGNAGDYGNIDHADWESGVYFSADVATDFAGNLYVVDSGNNTIRKATSTTRLTNLSVRTRVGTGEQTPIMGFFLSGPKHLLVRGVGPTLRPLGVADATVDPQLSLFDFLVRPIQGNDNWSGAPQLRETFGALGAFPLDAGSRDAALLATLDPGQYSARLTAAGAAGGVALLEAYDADTGGTGRLTDISVRTFAGTGDNTLIAGFVLTGLAPKTVLIRAAGPSLVRHGLEAAGVLADPRITLFQGATSLAANDNWSGTAELKTAGQRVGAFEFDSDESKDAALLVTLHPGVYTVHITGANAGTGVALIEIYDVP